MHYLMTHPGAAERVSATLVLPLIIGTRILDGPMSFVALAAYTRSPAGAGGARSARTRYKRRCMSGHPDCRG